MDSGGGSLVRVLPVEADSKVVDAEVIDAEVIESETIDTQPENEGFSLHPPADIWGSFVAGIAEGVRRGFRGG